jgi:D-tyrosyl-tRNA(Tyr) deacylase
MRAVVQRVTEASVTVDGLVVGQIGRGLLVLISVGDDDDEGHVGPMAAKLAGLRVFPDEAGRMNRSVTDESLELLLVSQFTLHGDVRKGKRPSFVKAAPPKRARQLIDAVGEALRATGLRVEEGRFAADMRVALVGDGPVTILLDTHKRF